MQHRIRIQAVDGRRPRPAPRADDGPAPGRGRLALACLLVYAGLVLTLAASFMSV